MFYSRRTMLIGSAAALAMPNVVRAQAPIEIPVGLPSASLGAGKLRLTSEMGFFAKHGMQGKFTVLDNATVSTAALIAGSVNFIQAGPGEIIAAQGNGRKAVAVESGYAGMAQSLVLAKAVAEKLGVSPTAPVVERLKALKGLTIGTVSATASVTVAIKSAAAEMANTEFRTTYLTQPGFAAAMESKAIDGFEASAPFSTVSVVKGQSVLWIDGPKGDLPSKYTPANSSIIITMREYAESNPDVIKRIRAALNDFSTALKERPDEVKATIARLYPDLDKPTLDYFYSAESQAWTGKLVTAEQMAHEIRFIKDSGIQLPNLDKLDPAAMILA